MKRDTRSFVLTDAMRWASTRTNRIKFNVKMKLKLHFNWLHCYSKSLHHFTFVFSVVFFPQVTEEKEGWKGRRVIEETGARKQVSADMWIKSVNKGRNQFCYLFVVIKRWRSHITATTDTYCTMHIFDLCHVT